MRFTGSLWWRLIGIYFILVGLISLSGVALGLRVYPIPGTNPNERPLWLYILLFPYFFLQELLSLIFTPITAGPPWMFNLIYDIINYAPAFILIFAGFMLLQYGKKEAK
jgi:hypothetical protein